MAALELVGVVILIVLALALPAMGETIQRRLDGPPDPELDAKFLAKIESDRYE